MTATLTARRPRADTRRSPSTKRRSRDRWRTAATSDIHDLYERSVQDPAVECEFIDQAWKERRGRLARSIREDFCGTAAMSVGWVKHRSTHVAYGVDLDESVLAWGRARLPRRLTPAQRRRLTLIRGDVRSVRTPSVDCVVAFNFSYFIFKTRGELREYYQRVRRALVADGLFILDAYGGSESFTEMEEERHLDGFTYVWDQHHFNPVTHHVINHIHFRFPDGTQIKKAFTYDWRLWTLPELRELLLEAGFKAVTVYWEGTDEKTGEGNGEWAPTTRGEDCPGWLAYLVAEK